MKSAFRLAALCAAFLVVAGSAGAEEISGATSVRKSAAEAPSRDELQWVMSAHDQAVADDLVAHFSGQGFTCDVVRQGATLWAIQIRRPASPREDPDGERRDAQAYAQSKGAEFNGGGIAPVGAVRLHNSGQSFPPSPEVNAAVSTLTPAQLIFAGQVAMQQCFMSNQGATQLFPCVSKAAAVKDATPGSKQVDFAIGANFFASFAFDAAYESLKQKGATADTLATLKKLALLNYEVWNGFCLSEHLSDEALGTALAADPAHVASGIAEVRKVRAVLEALKAGSDPVAAPAAPATASAVASPGARSVVIDGVTYTNP